MSDILMAKGDCTAVSPSSPEVAIGSPMQIHNFSDGVLDGQSPGLAPLQGPDPFTSCAHSSLAGCSPGKYILPCLRRSALPASPSTLLTKRPLAVEESLSWWDNLVFWGSAIAASATPATSPPNRSPPPQCRWLNGALQRLHRIVLAYVGAVPGESALLSLAPELQHSFVHSGGASPANQLDPSSTPSLPAVVGPPFPAHTKPPTESIKPGTPAYRRLLQTVCQASNTREVFEGARIKLDLVPSEIHLARLSK
ncbi:unnamed protein product [Calypogeia fissa]